MIAIGELTDLRRRFPRSRQVNARFGELRRLTRRLAVDKTVRPCRVDLQHSVTHRLETNAANSRRLAP